MTPVNDIMILLEGLGEGAHQTLAIKVLSPQINLTTLLEVVRGTQFRICGNRKMKKMSALSSGHVFYGQIIECY